MGGINWDSAPNNAYTLDISIGGHVLLGAHAIINLFDNHTDLKRWPLFHSTNDIFSHSTIQISLYIMQLMRIT